MTTIITIDEDQKVGDSRADLNTNFASLNSGKEEVGVSAADVTTHAGIRSGVHGLAITTGKTLTLTTSLTNQGGAGILAWPAAGATLTIPTGGGTLGTAAFTAATAYDASGAATTAVSNHAALLTGVHGLSITAGKVLTVQDNVTITGALGTGAYATIGDYAPVGQTFYIGKTQVAINRASAGLSITGITGVSDDTAGSFTLGGNAGGAWLQTNSTTPLLLGANSTTVLTVNTGAVTLADATNIVLNTTTGTKIGTVGGASGQKLAFWNATPIVQPVLATGAGKTADNIITVLQNLGLVRQS